MLLALPVVALLLTAADPDVAKFDDLWTRRDDPKASIQLGLLVSDFKATDDYDKLWRASRWYAWMGDANITDEQKKNYGKTGWDVGEKAKKLNPNGLEAKYWASTCIGVYSEAVGILNALMQGLEGKFRDPILEAAKADPTHSNPNVDYVGPQTLIGRYYYKLPWPKQSKDKSKEWLKQAIGAHPEELMAHYFYADVLKDDDKAAARKEIDLILNASESYDPPDARRQKRHAQALLTAMGK